MKTHILHTFSQNHAEFYFVEYIFEIKKLKGVAVNAEVLQKPNPLLVVNGKVNLNYVPPAKNAANSKKVVIEAQTHVYKM